MAETSSEHLIQEGARVGVFDSISSASADFYGYGTYTGEHLIPGWRSIALQLLPLHQGAWRRVLEADVPTLVVETMNLLEAERAVLAELGRFDEAPDVTPDVASQLVHERRAELARRLNWGEQEALEWLKFNEKLLRSPRFEMDDGRTLWGNQTWWSAEETARTRLEAMRAQGVLINQV